MIELYVQIAHTAYNKYLSSSLTNAHLKDYFNSCFQASIDHFATYQSWTCVNCLKSGKATQGWGQPPSKCPNCRSTAVYETGTFQARASVVGKAFANAFSYLMKIQFRLPLITTPGNTGTHDFEVTPDIAIEAKGSPSSFNNPDGRVTHLDRPGMKRSDTKKKAFDNAHTYRERKPKGLFFIVSNVIPPSLVGFRSADIDAIFDVTKIDRLQAMINEISERIDLKLLRTKRGLK
ncbi:MAG: hypothetical protein ABSB31_10480 [Dehalococcoidia bacterium]|jgi:hypothetical protein